MNDSDGIVDAETMNWTQKNWTTIIHQNSILRIPRNASKEIENYDEEYESKRVGNYLLSFPCQEVVSK